MIDQYKNLNTIIHNWEPRVKIIGLLALIFTFALINVLELMPVILLISFSVYLASGLPLAFLLKRLRLPGYFLVIMLILLIFVSQGTVLWELGPLAIKKEGLLNSLLIGARFLSILTLAITLWGTASFTDTIKAMRALGLPMIFADMMTFTYRYFFAISTDLKNMSYSLQLRGFKPRSLKDLSTLASMFGTIFVRSFDQSERVFAAMSIRGYGQTETFITYAKVSTKDILLLAIALIISVGLLTAQMYIS